MILMNNLRWGTVVTFNSQHIILGIWLSTPKARARFYTEATPHYSDSWIRRVWRVYQWSICHLPVVQYNFVSDFETFRTFPTFWRFGYLILVLMERVNIHISFNIRFFSNKLKWILIRKTMFYVQFFLHKNLITFRT